MQVETLKDLSFYYNSTDPRYIYIDKAFDIKGVDYTKFLQLKYETINQCHIRDKYTIEGWYILWYLMSRAIRSEYVATSVAIISEETSMKPIRVKEALLILAAHDVIHISKDVSEVSNNEMIQIYIGYNNKLCGHITQNGYTPLPVEFVYKVIPSLSPTEWAIFTVIVVKYNYFIAWEKLNSSSGKMEQKYQRTHYAFPTRTAIGEMLGVGDETIGKYLKKLLGSKYNLIDKYRTDAYSFWDEKDQKQKVRGGNNRYGIKLLERPEYAYYYLNPKFNKVEQRDFEYIKSNGFEAVALSDRQELIRGKIAYYIRYYYENILLLYEKSLKEKDEELYRQIRENLAIVN